MSTQQTLLIFLASLALLSAVAFLLGRTKASQARDNGQHMHSQPGEYGQFAAVAVALPALLAGGVLVVLETFGVLELAAGLPAWVGVGAAALGMVYGLRRIEPELRARNQVETVIRWLLIAASLVSILTTLGIVVSILFEAIRFFRLVSLWEFITGTEWSPDAVFAGGQGQFGAVPLFAGTFMITGIAMAVALPIGLLSAIFMSEYASPAVRTAAKPVLEVLAGIPTVVYGFFAAITISPYVVALAEFIGLDASYKNALAPGVVMGIMIIPIISSLSDDVISAVPNSLREGALALGSTQAETIRHVVVPAALPGIISAALLGVSRALGETMIVVMAASLRPNLTANPLEDMTTVTVRIVDALTGDQAFDSAETLSAFALGLVLFVVTLSLNLVSTVLVRRFRQKYE
ncbi:MAG: phosphate ABC transporter permease subunit PstC [Pseudomonadota bacterium]|nr:phosphate ABC transporter permease subunit PstC [Pseudomonadota bacterium]HJO35796.1 phosphate ABC transporter permease subunit PstC [Gammaproteobacteria bacterium]